MVSLGSTRAFLCTGEAPKRKLISRTDYYSKDACLTAVLAPGGVELRSRVTRSRQTWTVRMRLLWRNGAGELGLVRSVWPPR